MASLAEPELVFDPTGCPDPGRREAQLPAILPRVGDDFDWQTRDFDGFRIHMLEDLAARLPERRRWTRADLEVVLVEVLAAALDQLSDMTDRVFAESYLETARNPKNVLGLLRLIGSDPSQELTELEGLSAEAALLQQWTSNPLLMERARQQGPLRISEQQRMVTLADFEVELQRHPLVERANAARQWSGAFWQVQVALSLVQDIPLDAELPSQTKLREQITQFHRSRALHLADLGENPTPRAILDPYVQAYRMLGQGVELRGAIPVGLQIELCLRVDRDYFTSEIHRTALAALSRGAGQFFEPGRLRFGESVYASDLVQALTGLEGVQDVVVQVLKRVGSRYPNQALLGIVALSGLEVARCDNDPKNPAMGRVQITLHGGLTG